jgi:hypothetical protein
LGKYGHDTLIDEIYPMVGYKICPKTGPLHLLMTVLLLTFASACNSQSHIEASDESGTLVILARTATAVVVTVDSKVLSSTGGSPYRVPEPIDLSRKLVDVGDLSSCAISGNLGIKGDVSDVSLALRAWVQEHPHIEADNAIGGLMSASAEAWNSRHFQFGDTVPRQIGEIITSILCGGFSGGKAFIVRGQTVLNSDLTAHTEQLDSYGSDSFYVEGALYTAFLFHLVSNSYGWNPKFIVPEEEVELTRSVLKEIKTNSSTSKAFELWRANDQTCIDTHQALKGLHCAAPKWTENQVKTLISQIFRVVEAQDSEHVGRPNNARIIKACGRLIAEVEAPSWDVCTNSRATP